MKIEFKKFQGEFDAKSFLKKAVAFSVRKEPFVLGIIAMIFIAYFGYLWYAYNHNYRWDESKKQAYIKNKQTGVEFDAVKFEEVLKDVNGRKDDYEKELEALEDIFRLNKK